MEPLLKTSEKGRLKTGASVLLGFMVLSGCGSNYFGGDTAPTNSAPTPIETTVPQTTASKAESTTTVQPETPLDCVAALPLSFRVGQTIELPVYGTDLEADASIFAQEQIGGAIMMTSPANPQDGGILDFKRTAETYGVAPLVGTDQEGGIVQRFVYGGVLPSEQQVALTMSPTQAEAMIAADGRVLKTIGIDQVFGPVSDVAPPTGIGPDGSRTFSSNPAVVHAYVQAYIEGWQSAGIEPTIKHLPGLGSASGDTDYVTAVTPPLSYLETHDFLGFENLGYTKTAVMIGNMKVPGLTNGQLASVNTNTIDGLVRGQLGFTNNLIVSDALGADAVEQAGLTIPEAAVDFLEAGGDISLDLGDDSTTNRTDVAIIGSETIAAITSAVTNDQLSEAALDQKVLTILQVKGVNPCSITPSAS